MTHPSQNSLTREQLRVVLDEWFCGCGDPAAAAGALFRLLRLHPMYEHYDELHVWVGDGGLEYLLMYMLDRLELTEHGGSVGGAWLTDKGKATMEALAREAGDLFEELTSGTHCVHGFDVEDESHDCMAAENG